MSFGPWTQNTVGTGKHGAPFVVVPQFQSWFALHPDHVGFVIGGKGSTIKKIATDCQCYIKIQDGATSPLGMPWFLIKGSTEANVCEAFHRIRTIANEADRRMPRNVNASHDGPTPRPRAKLNIQTNSPSTPEPEPAEVTVVEKTDKDGNKILVDESTNEVYDSDGMLVGHFVGGMVMARVDASV